MESRQSLRQLSGEPTAVEGLTDSGWWLTDRIWPITASGWGFAADDQADNRRIKRQTCSLCSHLLPYSWHGAPERCQRTYARE